MGDPLDLNAPSSGDGSASQREQINDDGTDDGEDDFETDLPSTKMARDLDKSPSPSPDCIKEKGTPVYTPLEKQYLAIREKHPDLLLLVEVGYKYRFFGPDAEAAAHVLDIVAHPHKNFLTASIPSFRKDVHIRRLVEEGYKVGVVKQTELAASKRLNHSAGPFARELTEVYTKATLLPAVDSETVGDGAGVEGEAGGHSRFIMCLWEQPATDCNTSSNPDTNTNTYTNTNNDNDTLSGTSFSSSSSSSSSNSGSSSSHDVEAAREVQCAFVAADPSSGELVFDFFSSRCGI